jgi:hypothetical protein
VDGTSSVKDYKFASLFKSFTLRPYGTRYNCLLDDFAFAFVHLEDAFFSCVGRWDFCKLSKSFAHSIFHSSVYLYRLSQRPYGIGLSVSLLICYLIGGIKRLPGLEYKLLELPHVTRFVEVSNIDCKLQLLRSLKLYLEVALEFIGDVMRPNVQKFDLPEYKLMETMEDSRKTVMDGYWCIGLSRYTVVFVIAKLLGMFIDGKITESDYERVTASLQWSNVIRDTDKPVVTDKPCILPDTPTLCVRAEGVPGLYYWGFIRPSEYGSQINDASYFAKTMLSNSSRFLPSNPEGHPTKYSWLMPGVFNPNGSCVPTAIVTPGVSTSSSVRLS